MTPDTPIRGLSVVIPALDAARRLPATLYSLRRGRPAEVLVVDGGSTDDTVTLAEAEGCRVIRAPRGRGPQLAAGVSAASGDWLLFLHADTHLPDGWRAAVGGFMRDPDNRQRAAAFRLALDADKPAARRIERLAGWRAHRLGLPYGDQGLLIARDFYAALGGYRPLPLMEDVDLVRRIGRRRLALLPATTTTSADGYRRGGWWLRPTRNLGLLTLYYCGVPPALLAKWYR